MTMLSASAFASEVSKFDSGTTPEFYTATRQITPQHEEHVKKIMSGEIGLKVGESRIATEFDDGTVLYVKVIDEANAVTRAAKTRSQSFMFYFIII